MSTKHHRRSRTVLDTSRLEQLTLTAAGIDASSRCHWCAVDPSLDSRPVRMFNTYTDDLVALVDWFISVGITTVAIESTGVYWIPVVALLEARGIEVCVTDARATKQVAGRKSDISDCQWIQQLHSYGLLKPAVVLGEDQSTLRSYLRQRDRWVAACSRATQHMQKSLELMNLKLPEVLSDITGVTGMAIIESILKGVRDPMLLAEHRDPRCKKSEEEIARALHGCWQTDQLFALEQAHAHYLFLQARIADCDQRIDQLLTALYPPADDPAPPPAKPESKSKKALPFDARGHCYRLAGGVDLTTINGIGPLTALTVLSEIGSNIALWPTEGAFKSWLGLAPNNRTSAGRIYGRRSKPGNVRGAQALKMAAESLLNAQCALGAFARRLKARIGAPRAIKATAAKLAGIIYRMLRSKTPYKDIGQENYDARFIERRKRSIQKAAKQLGFALVPMETITS